eukprot:6474677-Amphidinium_carterae.1
MMTEFKTARVRRDQCTRSHGYDQEAGGTSSQGRGRIDLDTRSPWESCGQESRILDGALRGSFYSA